MIPFAALALILMPYFCVFPDHHRHIYDFDGATPRQRELLGKWRAQYRRLGLLGRFRRVMLKRQRRRRMPVRRVPAWVRRMKKLE